MSLEGTEDREECFVCVHAQHPFNGFIQNTRGPTRWMSQIEKSFVFSLSLPSLLCPLQLVQSILFVQHFSQYTLFQTKADLQKSWC